MKICKGRKRGFTLIEVILGVLIISIVSSASYLSFVFFSGEETSKRNELIAYNLSQKALEEVKAKAYLDFDSLESYYNKGWENISGYPNFQRNVSVTLVNGSTELKKIDVEIRWQQKGGAKSYFLSYLLSRPPDPLPGNIYGQVTNSVNSKPIEGAKVEIYYSTNHTLKKITYTGSDGSYTFVDTGGNFQLKPGTWIMKVSHSDYFGVEDISITVNSGENKQVNVALDPKPERGKITGRVINITDNKGISGIEVRLCRGGKILQKAWTDGNGRFTFNDVETQDASGQSYFYTVATYEVWKKGYCGNFPDHHGWGKNYNHEGWSSSIVREDGSIILSNPWWGSDESDRFSVDPGQTKDIGNIPLIPVPKATLWGYVYYFIKWGIPPTPLSGAQVKIWWMINWWTRPWWGSTYSGEDGKYTIQVPAVHELFPEKSGNGLYMEVSKSGAPPEGCGYQQTSRYLYPWGWGWGCKFYAGDVVQVDVYLYPEYCGNVAGQVIDERTGAGLSGVSVNVAGINGSSESGGQYCVPTGGCDPDNPLYVVPLGCHVLTAYKSGYYDFSTKGNYWYTRKGWWWQNGRVICVNKEQTTTYNFRMLNKGYGTITGRVVDAGSGDPIGGAKVELYLYTGSKTTVYTQSDGTFTINGVLESWPPPDLSSFNSDNYYQTTPRKHSLKVSFTAQYESTTVGNIDVEANKTTDLGDIPLSLKDQM